jgi:hypothetical protein
MSYLRRKTSAVADADWAGEALSGRQGADDPATRS